MTGKRKTEARRWFQQAYFDLKAVRWNIEGGFYDTACFLAQQSAEKALKSILYFTGSRRKALMTHSAVEMVREAGKKIAPYPTLEKSIWIYLGCLFLMVLVVDNANRFGEQLPVV